MVSEITNLYCQGHVTIRTRDFEVLRTDVANLLFSGNTDANFEEPTPEVCCRQNMNKNFQFFKPMNY